MDTAHFRRQHGEILAVVGLIVPHLSKPTSIDRKVGDQLRKHLVDLSARIGSHLTSEDKVLYPTLTKNPASPVAVTATRFADEMGTIGAAFKQYLSQYPTGEAISTNAGKFAKDTQAIIAALGNRIQREEKELYPLADAA